MQQRLFDKYVNIRFYPNNAVVEGNAGPRQTVKSILTPAQGPKPDIRLSGTWVTQNIVQQMEIRIVNLEVDEPLSDFGTLDRPGYVEIEAGYVGQTHTSIKGHIINSFQETPGPDGITTFQMLIGFFNQWTTATLSKNYPKGTSLRAILSDVCAALGLNLVYCPSLSPNLNVQRSLSHNGLAKDLLDKLKMMFVSYDESALFDGLQLLPFGDSLLAFAGQAGTGIAWQLDYVSNASHKASGFDIQAPWVPSVRPGDTVIVNPAFFRQDLGGSTVSPGNRFVAFLVEFEFDTVDETNMMTILTVGAQ